jgi:hypothetical protein
MNTENDPAPITYKNDFSRLEAIIYVFGINKRIWEFVDEFFLTTESDESKQLCLANVIDSFGLSPRAWDVLDKRYGFQHRLSLDETAVELGNVTRERVRQIQLTSLAKVQPGIHRLIILLLMIDEELPRNWDTFESITTVNEAIFVYQTLLVDLGWNPPQGKEIRQLLLLMRALVHANLLGIDKHFPHLSYAACRLNPPVLKQSKLAEEERERKRQQIEQERNWTYEELAEVVLTNADVPLHYMEIARRAEDLERRDNFNLKGMHNVLYSNSDKFVYVDQGTYGLVSWGLMSVDAYTDIIAEVLSTASKALPFGNILHSVDAKRSVKKQTLQMTLDMNPRFYYSQEGTYGLRAWLPAREKQTLRTPKWQVETSQSLERVARSLERGYDIDMIVSRDRA